MKKKTTRGTPELPREKEGFEKLPRDQVKVLQSRKRQKSRFFNNCRFSNMRTFHGKNRQNILPPIVSSEKEESGIVRKWTMTGLHL